MLKKEAGAGHVPAIADLHEVDVGGKAPQVERVGEGPHRVMALDFLAERVEDADLVRAALGGGRLDLEKAIAGIRADAHEAGEAGFVDGSAAGAGPGTDQPGAVIADDAEHAVALVERKHVHAAVIDVVHVVHVHLAIAITAATVERIVGEAGAAVVFLLCGGGVADEVVAAVRVAPDVVEEKPMADLVGGCTALVAGGDAAAADTKGGVVDHHAVVVRVIGEFVREGRVAVELVAEVADPDVEVAGRIPVVAAACGTELDVVGACTCEVGGCRGAGDAIGGIALRIDAGEAELDVAVGGDTAEGVTRRHDVGIEATEIFIQDVDLRLDLRVGDVLVCRFVDDMHDDRDRDGAATA